MVQYINAFGGGETHMEVIAFDFDPPKPQNEWGAERRFPQQNSDM